MRSVLFVCAVLTVTGAGSAFAHESVDFDEYFIDATMRIDFFFTGNTAAEEVTIDQLYRTGKWAGNTKKLIDELNLGSYYIKVVDIASNSLLYSRGFCCEFAEYRTTAPARQGIKKTYHESALIPFPKKPVHFILESRDRKNILQPLFTIKIDPADVNIIREKPHKSDRVVKSVSNGDPHDKVDIVFIGEGYTSKEFRKFRNDVKRFTGILFETEPFKSNKKKFNISGVVRFSADSGVDQPTKETFANTSIGASFNALDLQRYLLVDDNKAMRDIAGAVPYDYIVVIANTTRYGGGGIYNNYAIFTADNSRSKMLFLHEFGHSFAFLADEYYSSAVAYDEFYPKGVEPVEPNITALLDPENVKWKHLLSEGIEIPTPWGQEEIAQLRQQKEDNEKRTEEKIAKLEKKADSQEKIKKQRQKLTEANSELDAKIKQVQDEYLKKYEGKIGVFEGAGYTAKGLYRSEIHVGMYRDGKYGPVSDEGILRIIDLYSN